MTWNVIFINYWLKRHKTAHLPLNSKNTIYEKNIIKYNTFSFYINFK